MSLSQKEAFFTYMCHAIHFLSITTLFLYTIKIILGAIFFATGTQSGNISSSWFYPATGLDAVRWVQSGYKELCVDLLGIKSIEACGKVSSIFKSKESSPSKITGLWCWSPSQAANLFLIYQVEYKVIRFVTPVWLQFKSCDLSLHLCVRGMWWHVT